MKTPIRWFRVLSTATLLGVGLLILSFLIVTEGAVLRQAKNFSISNTMESFTLRRYANMLRRQTELLLAADPVADALANARSGDARLYTAEGYAGFVYIRGFPDPNSWLLGRCGDRDKGMGKTVASLDTSWEVYWKNPFFRKCSLRYDRADGPLFREVVQASERRDSTFDAYARAYNQTILAELRQRDPEVNAYMRKAEDRERQKVSGRVQDVEVNDPDNPVETVGESP